MQSPTASLHPSTRQRALSLTLSMTLQQTTGAGQSCTALHAPLSFQELTEPATSYCPPQRPTQSKNANRCKEGQLISRTTKPKGATGGLKSLFTLLGVVSQREPGAPSELLSGMAAPQGFLVEGWPRLVYGTKWQEGGKGREGEGGTNYTPAIILQESAWPLAHTTALPSSH